MEVRRLVLLGNRVHMHGVVGPTVGVPVFAGDNAGDRVAGGEAAARGGLGCSSPRGSCARHCHRRPRALGRQALLLWPFPQAALGWQLH